MLFVSLLVNGESVRIQIRRGSETTPTIRERSIPFHEFERLSHQWQDLYFRSQNATIHARGEIEARVRRKGRLLHTLLFGRKTFRVSETVVFCISPGLSSIPFEILHDGNCYVLQKHPIVRQLILPEHAPRLRVANTPARALLIFDGTHSEAIDASVTREKEDLVRIFRKNPDTSLKIIQGRADNVKEELLDSRFIHFGGHYSLQEEVDAVRAGDITGLDLSQTRFVFLNGCHTALADGSRLSLAEAFIDAGVHDFVGFGLPVETRKAQEISVALWPLILKGESPLIVLQKVRASLRETGTLDWLSLQHFASVADRSEPGRWRMIFLTGVAAAILVSLTLFVFAKERSGRGGDASDASASTSNTMRQPPSNNQVGVSRSTKPSGDLVRHSAPGTEERVAVIQIPAEPPVESLLREHQLDSSGDLGQVAFKFYQQSHPVYSQARRLEIIKAVLNLDASDQMKTIRLRSEMAKP